MGTEKEQKQILLSTDDKRLILENAHYVCSRCGKSGKPSTKKHRYLHIHHRDENPFNNSPTNLEVLCVKCHIKHHLLVNLGIICKKCSSTQIVKLGFKVTKLGQLQRYQCKKCGYVFTGKGDER